MKRIFRFLWKSVLIILGILVVFVIVLKLTFNDDVPQGVKGAKADELGFKILKAINHTEFTKAQEIHWTFRDKNTYRWKPQQNLVDVYWADYRVSYQTYFPNISFAFKGTQRLEGAAREEAIAYAQKNFNNDSFWLVAPNKIFDIGSERELVLEDGKEKLLVKYNSGGTTPGDAYLWEVDENYRPVSFKIWAQIIPLKGIEATWGNWEMTAGGFPLAHSHSIYGIEVPVKNIMVIK